MGKKAQMLWTWRTIFKEAVKLNEKYNTAEILDTDLPWRSRKKCRRDDILRTLKPRYFILAIKAETWLIEKYGQNEYKSDSSYLGGIKNERIHFKA